MTTHSGSTVVDAAQGTHHMHAIFSVSADTSLSWYVFSIYQHSSQSRWTPPLQTLCDPAGIVHVDIFSSSSLNRLASPDLTRALANPSLSIGSSAAEFEDHAFPNALVFLPLGCFGTAAKSSSPEGGSMVRRRCFWSTTGTMLLTKGTSRTLRGC